MGAAEAKKAEEEPKNAEEPAAEELKSKRRSRVIDIAALWSPKEKGGAKSESKWAVAQTKIKAVLAVENAARRGTHGEGVVVGKSDLMSLIGKAGSSEACSPM